ncbi:MAG: hypothetical protein Q7S95_00960 [bacterium]|nr:hypothetical protein [bacterium]
MKVVVKMKDGWGEETLVRLRAIGLVTESLISKRGLVIGTIDDSKLNWLKTSPDVQFVEPEMKYDPRHRPLSKRPGEEGLDK